MFFIATLSTVLMGYVSSKYGRYWACSLSLLIGSVGLIGMALSPNYTYAFVFYGIAGFNFTFLNFSATILAESGDGKFFGVSIGLVSVLYSVQEIAFIGVSYYF